MKRREFLAVLQVAGLGAGAALSGASGCSTTLSPEELEGASLRFTSRRMGWGHPVGVVLETPKAELSSPPRLQVIREAASKWTAAVGDEVTASAEFDGQRWRWQWTPPIVRPTNAEFQDEVVRFRLVAIDDVGCPLGLVSEPLEVVCATRGWGC